MNYNNHDNESNINNNNNRYEWGGIDIETHRAPERFGYSRWTLMIYNLSTYTAGFGFDSNLLRVVACSSAAVIEISYEILVSVRVTRMKTTAIFEFAATLDKIVWSRR